MPCLSLSLSGFVEAHASLSLSLVGLFRVLFGLSLGSAGLSWGTLDSLGALSDSQQALAGRNLSGRPAGADGTPSKPSC